MKKQVQATMVEHVSEYGQWQWYEVTFMPPKKAVKDYIDNHCFCSREVITKTSGGYEVEGLVRAFEITII